MPVLPLAKPVRIGRRGGPGNFGGGGGDDSLGRASIQLSRATELLFNAEQASELSRATAEASVQVDELRRSFESDPDYRTHGERFDKGVKDILKQQAEGLLGVTSRNDFEIRMKRAVAGSRFALNNDVRAKTLDRTRANKILSHDSYLKLAANDQDPDERQRHLALAAQERETGVESGVFTATQAAQMKLQADAFLEREGRKVQSQVIADELMREFSNPNDRRDANRERNTGALRDEVDTRLKNRNAEESASKSQREAATEEAIEEKFQEGLNLLAKGGLTAKWLDKNEEKMDGTRNLQLRNALAKGTTAGDPAYQDEMNTMSTEDPAGFAKVKLDPAKAGSAYKSLLKLQAKVRDDGRLDSLTSSLHDRVKTRADNLGLDDTQKELFRRRVDEELEEFVDRNSGKRPDRPQQDSIVDGLALEIDTNFLGATFFFDALGRIEAEGESINGVPGNVVEALIDDMEDEGARITTGSLRELYKKVRKQLGGVPTPEDVEEWLQTRRDLRAGR